MYKKEIEEYLTKDPDSSLVVREMLLAKVTKYDDIAEGFAAWIKTQDYSAAKVEVGEYTAEKIHELAPQLEGIGVFNFLVTLRDNPEEAKKNIESGFIVK